MKNQLLLTVVDNSLLQHIPHIYQFWYTAILFRLVTLKSVNSRQNSPKWSKWVKAGQNFKFFMLKSTTAQKSTPPPVVWLGLI